VVEVGEAVLVQANRAIGQLLRERGVGRRGDHRQVDGQRELGEEVQQGPQAVGAPARVVVAEEQRHRAVAGFEGVAHGLEHRPCDTRGASP
jgi:hypothetical protein